jgi:hypothetical protein
MNYPYIKLYFCVFFLLLSASAPLREKKHPFPDILKPRKITIQENGNNNLSPTQPPSKNAPILLTLRRR